MKSTKTSNNDLFSSYAEYSVEVNTEEDTQEVLSKIFYDRGYSSKNSCYNDESFDYYKE